MKCPSCSTELADNAKFCPECGEKIVRKTVCPDCGTEVAPGAKFCAECGHRFAAAPKPSAPKPSAPKPTAPKPSAPKPSAPKPSAPKPATLKAAVDRVFALFHDKDGNCKNATKKDARLVEAAAEGGDARAMFLFGEILSDGCEGFDKDPKAAAEWYRKSAEAGEAWGMSAYGMVLVNGDPDGGLEQNPDAAQEWIVKGGALLATQGEQTAMNALLLGSAVAQAPKPDGEDGPPDLGAAAAIAGVLLQEAGDVDPETATAVDRKAVGAAHFVLAMDAMSKKDFDLAREHLERGADFGNEDCGKALEEIEGGDGAGDAEDGDGESGDGTGAGGATGIVLSNCGFETKDGETFTLNFDLRNDGERDSGPLRVSLWYSKDGYDAEADRINGYVMAEAEVSVQSLRQGQSLEKVLFRDRERIDDPVTGDYVATLMAEELVDGGNPEEDGDWLIVDHFNFDVTIHWNHVGDDEEEGDDGDVSDETGDNGDMSDDAGESDDDGGVVEIGGHLARAGDSTLLDMKGCVYALAEAPADLEFAYVPTNVAVRIKRIANPTSQASGSIKVIFWVCKAEQDPNGDLEGDAAWEQVVSEESLRPGEAIEDISLSGEVMAAGKTWFVATVNELNGDGDWYIVARKDFPPVDFPTTVVGESSVAPEPPKPSLETGLTPEQAARLQSLCEDQRGSRPSGVFAIGREIDTGKLRKFGDAGNSKLGGREGLLFKREIIQAERDAMHAARFGADGAPIAFFDNAMFNSGKAGLLLTPKGLYSVNGMMGNKSCPSGSISWADFAGEKSSLELVDDYNLRICNSPQMGVNLSSFPAKEVRDILVKFRAFLRGE